MAGGQGSARSRHGSLLRNDTPPHSKFSRVARHLWVPRGVAAGKSAAMRPRPRMARGFSRQLPAQVANASTRGDREASSGIHGSLRVVRPTFFRSAARGLHVPTKLTPEPTKREARKRRANERHVVGCREELARATCEYALSDIS